MNSPPRSGTPRPCHTASNAPVPPSNQPGPSEMQAPNACSQPLWMWCKDCARHADSRKVVSTQCGSNTDPWVWIAFQPAPNTIRSATHHTSQRVSTEPALPRSVIAQSQPPINSRGRLRNHRDASASPTPVGSTSVTIDGGATVIVGDGSAGAIAAHGSDTLNLGAAASVGTFG